MDKSTRQAITVLNQGGIVIFPTDTVWGIGCRIDRPASIDRLFTIRKRPLIQAAPVLVYSGKIALTYWNSPSKIVDTLKKKYWPGALTIVSPCKKELVYTSVRGGGSTIGLRMPNHKKLLEVIAGSGGAILGPSANFHGEKTPVDFDDLDPELVKLVDYVLPGKSSSGLASTVVDCSEENPKILRQGAVFIVE